MNRIPALSPSVGRAGAAPGPAAVAERAGQPIAPRGQALGAAAHAMGLSGYLAGLGQRAGWASTGHGPRVAVVGSGIAGLSAAWTLSQQAHVTLFEAGGYFGGHTHTVDVALEGHRCGVDTGFLVFNERTYPLLIQLLAQLGVETVASEMSFSVQVPHLPHLGRAGLEWSGSNLNSVFSQRSNLVRPGFWRMLRDLLRFNRVTTALAEEGQEAALAQPIGEFLQAHSFSAEFRDWYLLPMVACIWSCPTAQMLQFPIQTLIRFCHNHGLLQVANRPQWFTVRGGARHYVDKLLPKIAETRLNTAVLGLQRQPGGVVLRTAQGVEHFDAVVLASHSDQSLRLLSDASREEQQILGAVRYHQNRAVLHTDTALLPRHRRTWAAWNYERGAGGQESQAVCLHYLLNRLQPLPWQQPTVVSLNPVREPSATKVLGEYDYAHPVFDQDAIQAQQRLGDIQGNGNVWFCGAWTRYGFHEDGLLSGLGVAQQLATAWSAQHRGSP